MSTTNDCTGPTSVGGIIVSADDLRMALRAVWHASAKDWARPVLEGIFLEPRERDGAMRLRVAAADNYRLAATEINGVAPDGAQPWDYGVSLPTELRAREKAAREAAEAEEANRRSVGQ